MKLKMWKTVTEALLLFLIINCITATHPPFIISQSEVKQIAFREGYSLQLPCVADADPEPTYRWEVNGREFLAAGTDDDVVELEGVGTLLFSRPSSQYSGFYKCFAENSFGVAVADTVQLINASLVAFPTESGGSYIRNAGEHLHIRCNQPASFPEATIFWSKLTLSGYQDIDYNDRVSIDLDGGLNFAFVDAPDSGSYICSAFNKVIRKTESSNPYTVTVRGTVGDSQSAPSKLLWAPRTTEKFIRGKPATIKCIYSGNPVPGIIWTRADKKPLSVRAKIRSYGLALQFDSIEYEDAANYECDGYNTAKATPVKTTVIVEVEGHVRWVDKPTSVTKGENETVTFVCNGEGMPRPNPPKWFINGVAFTSSTADRFIGNQYGPSTTLTIKNLQKDRDTMALQCNITNNLAGSWVHTSFFLNVKSEKPIIEQFDSGPYKWAEGQERNLTCKVVGAPTPIVSWTKDQQSLTGGRYITHDDGTLEVKGVGITDAGTYTCSASNRHGSVSKSTQITVRRRTQIRQAPEDLTVTAGTQAKFVCTALTDPDESGNLEITWLKDGNPMNSQSNNRVYRNVQDNSLQIAGPKSLDSGTYTCRASNGIDFDDANATLRVQDRPDMPPVVSIEQCGASWAEIKWSPGTNNNAPLTNFIVQYQTLTDQSIWYTSAEDIPPKTTSYTVQLKANNKYKFRVLAQNKIGKGEPSNPTIGQCDISVDEPKLNPVGVRTLDEGQDKLVITWQPISPIDFGAGSFVYNVLYKRFGSSQCNNKPYCVKPVAAKEGNLGRPGELNLIEYKVVVSGQPIYTKYSIAVTTENSQGDSSAATEFVIGYSGEGNPKQNVQGFGVMVNETTGKQEVYSENATFVWNAVDESEAETQGFFRGYMIEYKKNIKDDSTNERFDTRTVYIVIRDVKKEGTGSVADRRLVENEHGAVEHDDGRVSVTLTHLPPNSDLDFRIAVINKRRYGTLSAPLNVITKEGVPGPVQQLVISENGPTHIRLSWMKPLEPNGVLIRYQIGYKTLNGLQLGPLQYPDSRFVPDEGGVSAKISAKVTGLKPMQMYRFYVWAYTAAGPGSEYFIDDSTVSAGYPDPPTIDVRRLSNSTLNVSWVPARSGVPANVFYVQYKQQSAIDQWQRTGWETNKDYIMVGNFVPGWRYEVRVVASNGGIYETASESIDIFPTAVSRSSAEATQVFSSGWFIGLMLSLILACTFFALLCLIQQNTGGIYTQPFSPEETERLKPYEESTFEEKIAPGGGDGEFDTAASERYAPSHFSERYPQSTYSERYAPSQHSERYVGSQPPPTDEYMQDDHNRYGEEGSFIGQYRDNKELPNFRPRVAEPYRPAQPQPRPRVAPTEETYGGPPVAEPRSGYAPRGGYASRGGVAPPRQAPPRQPRSAATESSDDYRPQYSSRTGKYDSDTRYRPAPEEAEEENHDTVV